MSFQNIYIVEEKSWEMGVETVELDGGEEEGRTPPLDAGNICGS